MTNEPDPLEMTQAEQEETYGGPLPEGLTIRRFSPEEIAALDSVVS